MGGSFFGSSSSRSSDRRRNLTWVKRRSGGPPPTCSPSSLLAYKGQPVRKMQSWRSSLSTEPSDDYPSTVKFSLSSGAEEAVSTQDSRDEGYLAFLNFLSADSAHNEEGAAKNGGKGGKANEEVEAHLHGNVMSNVEGKTDTCLALGIQEPRVEESGKSNSHDNVKIPNTLETDEGFSFLEAKNSSTVEDTESCTNKAPSPPVSAITATARQDQKEEGETIEVGTIQLFWPILITVT